MLNNKVIIEEHFVSATLKALNVVAKHELLILQHYENTGIDPILTRRKLRITIQFEELNE